MNVMVTCQPVLITLIEYGDARCDLSASCLSPKTIQNGRMRNSSAVRLNCYRSCLANVSTVLYNLYVLVQEK